MNENRSETIDDFIARMAPETVAELVAVPVKYFCKLVFEQIGACEGSLWWKYPDADHLEIIYNSGPVSEKLVGKVKQPLSEGIVSLVYHSGEPLYTNQICDEPNHSKYIDTELGQETHRLLACPLLVGGRIVGAITAVVLDKNSTKHFGFSDLESVQNLSEMLQFYWERAIFNDVLKGM